MVERWNQWYPHHIDNWQGSANIQALSGVAYRAVHKLLQDMWKLPEKTLRVKLDDLMDFVEWRFHGIVQHPWSTVNGKRLAVEHKHLWVHGKK